MKKPNSHDPFPIITHKAEQRLNVGVTELFKGLKFTAKAPNKRRSTENAGMTPETMIQMCRQRLAENMKTPHWQSAVASALSSKDPQSNDGDDMSEDSAIEEALLIAAGIDQVEPDEETDEALLDLAQQFAMAVIADVYSVLTGKELTDSMIKRVYQRILMEGSEDDTN